MRLIANVSYWESLASAGAKARADVPSTSVRIHAWVTGVQLHSRRPTAWRTRRRCKWMPLRHVNTDVLVIALRVVRALLREHEW